MLHRSFKPAKCKTSLKLATSRIKLMKNKKGVQINQMKRELSQLLETGQDRTARIRVEHVIREEKMVAAFDLLEIYCELIAARLPMIETQKHCPIDLKEAVTSVIFASPRCADIPELQDVRKHFTAKYGKEFITAAIELRPDCGVGRMLIEKLSTVAPDVQTKIKVLTAVAEEHNIKWDPTAFEEQESKPPNDLLNGPKMFEKASTIHADPPQFPAVPNVQVPHYHEQRHDEPSNNISQQNSRSSHGTQNFEYTDTGGNQTSYAASHARPSGRGAERMEFRQSFSRDGNDSSSGRQNWNMEFKDATAAAQAAAESAERASMAARAAAELSRQGKSSGQYSTDSHNSNFREEGPQRYGEQYSRNSVNNNSFSERKPQVQNQQRDRSEPDFSDKAADRFFEDDNGNNRRSSRAASLKPRTDSINDDTSANTLHKANHSQGSVEVEKTTAFPEISIREHSRREHEDDLVKSRQDGFKSYREEMPANRSSTSSSRSHSINFDDEYIVPRSDSWKFKNDTVEDSSIRGDHRNIYKETPKTSTYDYGADDIAFDEVNSDDDRPRFDTGPSFDEIDAKSFFPSPGRESPIHSLEPMNSWSPRSMRKSVEESGFQAQNISERRTSLGFSDYAAKSIYSSEPDNQVPTAFNSLDDPGFDNDDEHGTRQSHTANYDLDHSELNDRGTESDTRSPKNINSERSRFELTDLLEAESSLPSPVEEEKNVQSQQSTRLSHRNELENDFQVPQSSYSESGQELNFGPLTGGLRNKGYTRPSYTRNPSGDDSSLPQKLPEVEPAQMPTPAVNSSLNSVSRRMEHKESSIPHTSSGSDSNYSRSTQEYSQKTREEITKPRFEPPAGFLYPEDDDPDDDIPQQSSTSRVHLGHKESSTPRTGSGSDSNYSRSTQEYSQKTREEIMKSRFEPPAGFLYPEDDDPDDDIPQQSSTSRVRLGAGLSRRTKPTPSSETSSSKVRVEPEGKIIKSASDADRKPTRHFNSDQSPPEPRSYSGSFKQETPKPKHESRPTRHEENLKPQAAEKPSSPLKKTAESGKTENTKTSDSGGGTPMGENSVQKPSHVHPKLPDYDDIAARLQALRMNR